jgi:predicted aminopeptidase
VTHNTFYASGQAVFNESFANFVGARGAAWFFRSRGAEKAAAETEAQWEDEKLLAAFWTSLSQTIDSAFDAHPDNRDARLAVRDTLYGRAREHLVRDIGPQLRTISPRYVERVRLDNAALLARRIYLTDLDLFDSVYVREGRDLKRSMRRIIALARAEPKDPYRALRNWVGVSKP